MTAMVEIPTNLLEDLLEKEAYLKCLNIVLHSSGYASAPLILKQAEALFNSKNEVKE